MPAPRIPHSEWDRHKEEISRLYASERRSLEETMATIESNHGFSATKAQYVRKLEAWGLKKNVTTAEWKKAAEIVEKRKAKGKDTQVVISGKVISSKRLRKGLGRPEVKRSRFDSANGDQSVRQITVVSPSPAPQPESLTIRATTDTNHKETTKISLSGLPFSQLSWLSILPPANDSMNGLVDRVDHDNVVKMMKLPSSLQHIDEEPGVISVDTDAPQSVGDNTVELFGNDETSQIFSHQPFMPLLRCVLYMSSNALLSDKIMDYIIHWVFESGFSCAISHLINPNEPSMGRFASELLAASVSRRIFISHQARQKQADLEFVRGLLDAGASPNVMSREYQLSVLALAANQEDLELVKLFLQYGADASYSGRPFATVLDTFAELHCQVHRTVRGIEAQSIISILMSLETVPSKKFMACVPDIWSLSIGDPICPPDFLSFIGGISLYPAHKIELKQDYALRTGNVALMQELLGLGADPELMCFSLQTQSGTTQQEFEPCTPITLSIRAGNFVMTRLLLENGADPNGVVSVAELKKCYDETTDPTCAPAQPPLYQAAVSVNIATIDLLLSYGANMALPGLTDHIQGLLSGRCDNRLFEAIESGDADLVEATLGLGANPNIPRFPDGLTALEVAIEKRLFVILNILVENGASGRTKQSIITTAVDAFAPEFLEVIIQHGGNVKNVKGVTIPERLAFDFDSGDGEGIGETMLILLDHGVDINSHCPERRTGTFLELAVAVENFAIVQYLLENGADPNIVSTANFPALHMVCKAENPIFKIKTIEALVSLAADINAYELVDLYGNYASVLDEIAFEKPACLKLTPIQVAAMHGEGRRILSLMLTKGADINALPGDPEGFTALQLAVLCKKLATVDILLELGADINAPAALESGCTALQAVALAGEEWHAQDFLHRGADVNAPAPSKYGFTALQAAIIAGNDTLIHLFLEAGADVNAAPASKGGRTALQAAVLRSDYNLVNDLIGRGANVNAPACQERGATALQFAAIKGTFDIVILLLKHSADINARPSEVEGRTALQAAAEYGRLDTVHLFLENGGTGMKCCERDEAAILAQQDGHSHVASYINSWSAKMLPSPTIENDSLLG